MKHFSVLLLICCLGFSVSAQKPKKQDKGTSPTFTNPIFAGDYPDPSILRDGDDFYIVHSSFEYYPGLTIWHLKDLVMFYSLDGEHWIKTENSLEVSGFHHNVLGGFMGMRIGLCSMGEGNVKFKNFIYNAIK